MFIYLYLGVCKWVGESVPCFPWASDVVVSFDWVSYSVSCINCAETVVAYSELGPAQPLHISKLNFKSKLKLSYIVPWYHT